jgi:uncharacterized protein
MQKTDWLSDLMTEAKFMTRQLCTAILLTILAFVSVSAQQRQIDRDFLNAVDQKNIAEINSLLQRGANINAQEPINGHFALQYAINWPDIALLKLLLDKGANVNLTDKGGNTALTDAARRGGPEYAAITKLLIERGADVHANGDSAIIDAAREAQPDIVRLLLSKGAPANVRDPDRKNNTVLMEAASGSSVENVQLLIEAGADIQATNDEGQTAFMKAVRLDHRISPAQRLPIIELLLSKGSDINQKDKQGKTPLLLSVDQYMNESGGYKSHPEVVKYLLDHGANVQSANERGDTALMITVDAWQPPIEIPRLLIDRGINLNAQNKQGTTALMIAIGDGKLDLVNLILNKGADLNIKNVSGETALDTAVANGRVEIAKLLLARGARSTRTYANEVELTKATIDAALLRSASATNLKEVRQQIEAGANLNARSKRGQTPLMLAVENSYGRLEVVQLLIDRGADVNLVDEDGNSAVMIASEGNLSEAVTLLLASKAVVYLKNKNRQTALHIAAAGLRRKIVADLLATRPEVTASSAGVDVRGIDVNEVDASGRTPLMLAADNEGFVPDEVMQLLLDHGAQIDSRDPVGDTALIIAARVGSMSGVEFLVSKHANVNVKNNAGQTALTVARKIHENKKIYNAKLVEQRIVETLLKAGAKE